ncbi:Uracil-DNA glycosylase [Orpheovirus IHUMI-LCC2]|uniref:Uracil-DNA glycosylase n=1 Tax=Orpheovirus IHUMI-LCC2 TaxID=2023057 RepID=A0A2I2L683_9VIRU|nr:Uracil-DNA glycosylase [Orpheovirus IHUMI-LCC2]SNW62969.1 Uracil-DNA glycosylase [Orpheovirus IHUMI-LCC2]
MELIIASEPITNTTPIDKVAEIYTPPGWTNLFTRMKDDLYEIARNIENKEKEFGLISYPKRIDIFRAFHLTPLNKVRVVIIGQDPYHSTGNGGQPVADGLSFSTHGIQPSLSNIFTEIKNNYPDFQPPKCGRLDYWAYQGVFMYNTTLTVTPGKPNEHQGMWDGFTEDVIKEITNTRPNVIFCLWGNEAKKMKKLLGNKCIVLESSHPSPLGANKGFFGCGHFKKINDYLLSFGETPIDWQL